LEKRKEESLDLDKVLIEKIEVHKVPVRPLKISSTNRFMRLADTGVTAKNLLSWKKSNVLIQLNNDENKWTKFNYYEYFWLMMVKELREFGVSLKIIEKIKNELIYPFEHFEENLKKYSIRELKADYPDKTDEDLKHMSEVLVFSKTSRTFGRALLESICTRLNIEMIVFKEGDAYFHEDGEQYLFKKYDFADDEKRYDIKNIQHIDLLKYRSHITISFEQILKRYTLQEKNITNALGLEIITEEEKKVLEHIRKNDLKQVTIKYKNKKINLIEVEEETRIVDIESRFYDHIRKDGYQEITYYTENGTMTSFIRKTKIKI
jgi:DNA-binding transcriptional MerR regulator